MGRKFGVCEGVRRLRTFSSWFFIFCSHRKIYATLGDKARRSSSEPALKLDAKCSVNWNHPQDPAASVRVLNNEFSFIFFFLVSIFDLRDCRWVVLVKEKSGLVWSVIYCILSWVLLHFWVSNSVKFNGFRKFDELKLRRLKFNVFTSMDSETILHCITCRYFKKFLCKT